MVFEQLFLISVYARDKPIESLSEFNHYLSLLTNPEFFIDAPEGLTGKRHNVCESVRAVHVLSPTTSILGAIFWH